LRSEKKGDHCGRMLSKVTGNNIKAIQRRSNRTP